MFVQINTDKIFMNHMLPDLQSRQTKIWQCDALNMKTSSLHLTTNFLYPSLFPLFYAKPGCRIKITTLHPVSLKASTVTNCVRSDVMHWSATKIAS